MDVTLAVSRRAGHCWSAGVRCFILIIPLILWIMGPTSLLVTSVVLLLFLVSTDFVRVHNTTHAAGDVDELQVGSGFELGTGVSIRVRVELGMQSASGSGLGYIHECDTLRHDLVGAVVYQDASLL